MLKNPIVLFRAEDCYDEELQTCKASIPTVTSRMEIPENSLVIARYSALPFYKELCYDLETIRSRLINSYDQHSYVADIGLWYKDFRGITPETWLHNLGPVPEDYKGSYVVKGMTNSRKHQWNTCMFAENREGVNKVLSNLINDTMIGQQDLYLREFVNLHTYGVAINELPITEEYRLFFLNGKFLAGGFYWSEHIDYIQETTAEERWPNIANIPKGFIKDIGSRVKDKVPFCVIDVGRVGEKSRDKYGDWIVIELNDGQMSGLSLVEPHSLYTNLKERL